MDFDTHPAVPLFKPSDLIAYLLECPSRYQATLVIFLLCGSEPVNNVTDGLTACTLGRLG